jgi:hypothetical protein
VRDGEAAGDEGLARVGAPDVGAEGRVLGVLAEEHGCYARRLAQHAPLGLVPVVIAGMHTVSCPTSHAAGAPPGAATASASIMAARRTSFLIAMAVVVRRMLVYSTLSQWQVLCVMECCNGGVEMDLGSPGVFIVSLATHGLRHRAELDHRPCAAK